ncbi:ABC transporter ATP-binding protein [Clostridium intestinale]|uniref:ABC transporter ATP-binding protein n=1 Tax=Clostridium intestinale TaxID=36845 RepID=UPI002DD647A7|nr:ABC transporter ATP-binding protein [Clostridium intestinale]WRY51851.1 ABC transporter ATP-binding protein [Clostridium intestinale]
MLEFKNVSKSYGKTKVLKNINLTINTGELMVLIGPSGCGKTTLLKMINKLIPTSEGEILLNNTAIKDIDTIALRRNMGYVIQQTGLFPHMTVGENIALVPKLLKWDEEKIKARTEELLNLVGLEPQKYRDRYPRDLSGGQQQRVGVARAFATNPEVILMDEPFSALDPITRAQLQEELFNIQQEFKKTIVFVTHDMDEAIKIGDRICIMKDGDILQLDKPENIIKNPAEGFVEEFIGKSRIWNNPEMIKATDIMIEEPVVSNKARTLFQALELMRGKKVDSLLLVNKERELEGIITMKSIRINQDKQFVEEVMEKDIISVSKDASIIEILETMNEKSIGYVPVVENKKLLGLITKSTLVSVLSNQYLE